MKCIQILWLIHDITWWRFQEWAARCRPEHTSSSLWTGGTGPACKGHRVHIQGWRWLPEDSAEPRPARSDAPGHKRELSLKPWETHLIRKHRRQETTHKHKDSLDYGMVENDKTVDHLAIVELIWFNRVRDDIKLLLKKNQSECWRLWRLTTSDASNQLPPGVADITVVSVCLVLLLKEKLLVILYTRERRTW